MIIFRYLWRLMLCLYAPFLYFIDYFENGIFGNQRYGDGDGWSFARTTVTFLKYWYYF
jgi:hypothetical protein